MKIKRFNQFVFESFSSVNEGGKVFDDTKKIKLEYVDATIKDIEEKLLSPLGLRLGKNAIKLGSAGHADVSGDIDFGVIGKDLDELYDTLKMKFPRNETNFIKGLEVLSTSWPISGDKGLVQVDMIPVYNKKWTEFIYKYPEGSKYKSAHRNWLMMAVLSAIRENEIKDPNTDEVLSYDGFLLNLNKGLFSMKKDYHGKTKTLKHGNIVEEKLKTIDPIELVHFVFGKRYKLEDVETFEKAYSIINREDFKWRNNKKTIKENLKKFLIRADLKLP